MLADVRAVAAFILVLLLMPHAAAVLVPWPSEADPAGGVVDAAVSIVEYVGSPSAAPAGEYIDLVTHVVYRDDGEGLKPAGFGIPWFGYGYADVYSHKERPHPFAASADECLKDFCIAWIVAITGTHHVRIEWIAQSDCGTKKGSEEFGPVGVPDPTRRLPLGAGGVTGLSSPASGGLPAVETVTYTKGTLQIDWCERGYAAVMIYVDDVVQFSNSAPYCRPLYETDGC